MIELNRTRQLVFFTVLAVLSYAVYDAYFSTQSTTPFEPFTKGYALTGVTIETTDEDGKIMTTIQSPSVIHYADSEKTVIEQPNITLYEDEGDWVFQSKTGEINAEQTQIFFPDAVAINLTAPVKNNSQPMTINTRGLTVDVTKKMGQTDADLKVIQVGSFIQGVGAVVDFGQQEIEILNKMYAEYEN